MLDGYGNRSEGAGLIRCFRCNALYNSNARWMRVSYDPGSTRSHWDHFHGMIAEGFCPICRKPPLREQPQRGYQCGM